MRITLIHNPKAGDAKHGRKQLMAALAKAGHHAIYQSTNERGFKKALKQPTDLVLVAGGDGTTAKGRVPARRQGHSLKRSAAWHGQ